MNYLVIKRNVSAATQSVALNALIFLYKHIVERPLGAILAHSVVKTTEIYTHVLKRGAQGVKSPLSGENGTGTTAVDSRGNNLAVTVKGPDFLPRTSLAAFDPSGRRLVSATNALSHSQTTTHYPVDSTASGAYPHKIETLTDANGVKTHMAYDAFGRLTQRTAAWGSASPVNSHTTFRFCDVSCPATAAYYRVDKTDGSGETRTYLDIHGRTVREAALALKMVSAAPLFVYKDYTYNTLGLNTAVSEPYFETDSPTLWTYFVYDELGRKLKITAPDGRIDTITYNGLTVTSHTDINGKNQQKTTAKNMLGELISTTDHALKALSYSYDSHGNLLTVSDPASNVINMTYDVLGRKTSTHDPDKGNWTYTYNGLNQLITQTNARGATTCNAYDLLGRTVKRIDNYQGLLSTETGAASQSTDQCAGDAANVNIAVWTYDTAVGAGKGKLHNVQGENGYQTEIVYDNLGRPTEHTQTVNGTAYLSSVSYDNLNRPLQNTYPGVTNRLQVKNIYNNVGMLVELRNGADNALYYQSKELDVRGNVVDALYGNGVETTRTFNATTGRITDIGSMTSGSTSLDVQQLSFNFDTLGNLTQRIDTRNNIKEDFLYDNLNRLLENKADFGNADIQTTAVSYDSIGNILTKTGVGTYHYGSSCTTGFGPHAVCQTSGTKNTHYTYDANGNMTSGDGRTLHYTVFDKPSRIEKGTTVTDIRYGPDRSRYFRKDTVAGKVVEYTYVGGYEKVVFKDDGVNSNKVQERHHIGGFVVVTIENRGTVNELSKTRYLHKDHLGSVTTITDEVGTIVENFSFDPWGKRRAPSLAALEAALGNWASLSLLQKANLTLSAQQLQSTTTHRGFTGHEQLDPVGLIHMNGRVYDAELGRMIQADPFVPVFTDLQAYNRYAYVRNNPLSLVDPSGYSWLSKQWKKARKRLKRRYKLSLKYNIAHQLHKKLDNQINRTTIRIHQFNKRWSPGLAEIDDYLGSHQWARVVVLAVVAYFTKSSESTIAVASALAATQKHLAYTQGASPNQMRRIGTTAFITSVIDTWTQGLSGGGSSSAPQAGTVFSFDDAVKSTSDSTSLWEKSKALANLLRGSYNTVSSLDQGVGDAQKGQVTVEDLKGGVLDYNGQNVTNPAVRENLEKLRYGLNAAGYGDSDLVVTGGSSKWDSELGASVSTVDGNVIPGRRISSAHNLLNGARDVDIRGRALNGISEAEFNRIVTKYTDFNRISDFGRYADGHIHVGLPRKFSCYNPEGC